MAEYGSREAIFIFGFYLGILQLALCNEVTILDTRDSIDGERLGWTTFSRTQAPTPGVRVGWREGSYNLPNSDTIRLYTVCNVDFENVDNWLRTPYIPRGEANRLYIEMRFTMRKCTKFPDPENLQQCKESFKLYYYEAESDFANAQMPTWDTSTYAHVDVVAADQTFTESYDAVVNREIRSIPITRRGIYLAFHDQGACTTLLSIKVYYVMCPNITLNFATFPDAMTGPDVSSIVQQDGVCVNHAAIERPPSYLCKADGTWYFLSGGCKCMPGYEPEGDTKCAACPAHKYKWRTGTYACSPCPEHSYAPNNGSVECRCQEGYYRNIQDDKSMPCTRPPTEIRNLTVVTISQFKVNLTWLPPLDYGGRRDLTYRVDCIGCPATVTYKPKQDNFNTTSVLVDGLNQDTSYKIIVTAENGVSRQSGIVRETSIIIHTQVDVPSKVQNLRIMSVGTTHITILWEPPADHNIVQQYEIRFYTDNIVANFTSVTTTRHNYTFFNLRQKTRCSFEVRGRTAQGWGEFSHPISATTGDIVDRDNTGIKVNASDNPTAIIAGSAVAVVVCMVIVIIMVIIFLRSMAGYKFPEFLTACFQSGNHRACNEKNVSDCDTLQYSNVQCPSVIDGPHILNGLTVPLFQPPGSYRTYIDPHTYEDPNQAVREFTKEIDASLITIESVIGGGEFGDVCKGKLRVPLKGELTVAIKTLKAGASDKNRLDFLTEASIMGQFDDPNVIYLEGVVTKSNPIMIVTEYMENGSLDSFLRNNDGKFTVIQLVGMMRGIASGMMYLSDTGYVHRDLAARNILVNESLVCKVADFGLSREIESDTTEGAYTTKGGKIPVRWTAPEAIAYRKFTGASDVWSYGVVMWEVMSYGERPYWNWSNQDVIKAIDKNFRLPPPMDCPEAIHQLMLDCWQKERGHRPKFSAIVKTLDKLIRSPELLRKIAKPRPHDYFNPDTPDLTNYDSIEEWLTSIKMERYIDHFLQAGCTAMDQVAHVTLNDLKNLGVTLVGHQKKIMNSIQTLRAQMFGVQVSEGFLV